MDKFKYFLMLTVMTLIVSLVIRPYFPIFYNKMYGIDVGGWVMYKYDLVPEYNLTLISNTTTVDLNIYDYIWHGSFANSPHPNYNKNVMRKFLDILVTKNEINYIINKENIKLIKFDMKLTKNREYWKTITVEKEVK